MSGELLEHLKKTRRRERELMEMLAQWQAQKQTPCPLCQRADLWLPCLRSTGGYFPGLIRCHCNHCGTEWDPFWLG